MDTPWTKTPEEVLQYYAVDPTSGLGPIQVAKHAELYGKNGLLVYISLNVLDHAQSYTELPVEPPTPLWELILDQFKDQLVLILLMSAFVSFILALLEDLEGKSWATAFVEPIVILLILIANAAVGVIQESSAEKAIEASPFNYNMSLTY